MNKNPEISIIVPVYNVEKYLNRCIDSILNQRFKDFEVILVDDGSTDKSGVICDEYKKLDNRIVVIHKDNGGAGLARNVGLDIAKGKYIGFVDSDDYINENMYFKLHDKLVNTNSDIALCKYQEVKEDEEIKYINEEIKIKSFNSVEALENYFLDYRNKNKVMYTVIYDKLYKRELFSEIRFPNISFAEDGYVVYKLLYFSKKITFINDTLYYYFQRDNSLSRTNFSNKYLEAYRDRKEIFDFMYNKNKYLAKLAVPKYIDKHILTYNQLMTNNYIDNNEIYESSIRYDLKKDLKKFKELNINKYYINKVRVFIFNYKFVLLYDKIKNFKDIIKIKFKI